MKILFISLGKILVFMAFLSVFFCLLPIVSIASNQKTYLLASPIPIACYMALATVSAKKMWHKLWLNSLFCVGNITTVVLAWGYIIPKYMPEFYKLNKSHPEIMVQAGLNCVIVYLVSVTLFVAVYHIGRKTKSEGVLS